MVKDTWRDDARGMEGELYEAIGDAPGVASMYAHGAVMIAGRTPGLEQDDTCNLIRKKLKTTGKPVAIDFQQKHPPSELISTTDTSVVPKFTFPDDDDYLPETEPGLSVPRNRVHSRLVLRTLGWPIKYSCSPREVIGVMMDAIIGMLLSYWSDAQLTHA